MRSCRGGADGQPYGRTYGCMDGHLKIHPCVLQDISPLGPLPKKGTNRPTNQPTNQQTDRPKYRGVESRSTRLIKNLIHNVWAHQNCPRDNGDYFLSSCLFSHFSPLEMPHLDFHITSKNQQKICRIWESSRFICM